MQYRIRLTHLSRQTLVEQLERAYQAAHLRLVKRIHALLYVVDGKSVAEVSQLLHLGEQTIRDYLQALLVHGAESLHYRRPPGRPARLTKGQRKELDEASFAQWGSLRYTWAPKGQQPTVKTSGRRKGYKVFGLIEFFSGRLFWKGQTDRFNAESYIAFLTQVLAETHEPLILIQDGAKYHTCQTTRDFLAAHAERLTKFQLPSYSPDFNPIEHLWRNVKKDATHLKYFPTFEALTEKVATTLHKLAGLPSHILALMGCYCESLGAAA